MWSPTQFLNLHVGLQDKSAVKGRFWIYFILRILQNNNFNLAVADCWIELALWADRAFCNPTLCDPSEVPGWTWARFDDDARWRRWVRETRQWEAPTSWRFLALLIGEPIRWSKRSKFSKFESGAPPKRIRVGEFELARTVCAQKNAEFLHSAVLTRRVPQPRHFCHKGPNLPGGCARPRDKASAWDSIILSPLKFALCNLLWCYQIKRLNRDAL